MRYHLTASELQEAELLVVSIYRCCLPVDQLSTRALPQDNIVEIALSVFPLVTCQWIQ